MMSFNYNEEFSLRPIVLVIVLVFRKSLFVKFKMWNFASLYFGVFCHSGIGRATTLALAHCGAKVVAVTRSQADLNSLLQEVTLLLLCNPDRVPILYLMLI